MEARGRPLPGLEGRADLVSGSSDFPFALVTEGIDDPHAAKAAAVLEILGQHLSASARRCGGEEQCFPRGDPVATAAPGGGQDLIRLDRDHGKLDEPAQRGFGLVGRERPQELPGDGHEELLEGLGADHDGRATMRSRAIGDLPVSVASPRLHVPRGTRRTASASMALEHRWKPPTMLSPA
jgi:hypothetical protein